jgi:peptide subunit release factor 1 (eRF1)
MNNQEIVAKYNELFKESKETAETWLSEFFKNSTLTIPEKGQIRDLVNVTKKAFDKKQAAAAKKQATAAKKAEKERKSRFAYSEAEAYRRFDIPAYDPENKRWYDAEY